MAARGRGFRVERALGSLEARIMRDVWRNGESSVTDVLNRVNRRRSRKLAYNTVMSVMARLADKEILTRRRVGRAYHYAPAMTEAELAQHLAERSIRGLINDFSDAAVAGFVSVVNHDPELRAELRRLLDNSSEDR